MEFAHSAELTCRSHTQVKTERLSSYRAIDDMTIFEIYYEPNASKHQDTCTSRECSNASKAVSYV